MSGAAIAAEVAAALAEAGAATGTGTLIATIRRRGTAFGPVFAPTYGPPTEHVCNAITSHYSAREREGTSILATDIKVLASTLDIDPTPADSLIIGGETFKIVDAMPLDPGGVVLMWTLQARK